MGKRCNLLECYIERITGDFFFPNSIHRKAHHCPYFISFWAPKYPRAENL